MASAHPGELRTYAAYTAGAATDISDAVTALSTKIATLRAGLPSPYDVGADVDLTFLAVERIRGVDAHVDTIATLFDEAQYGQDGVATIDDAALPRMTEYYEETTLAALAARAEDELSTLRERLASGSTDETTLEELLGLLELTSVLVTGPDGLDQQIATAEGLIDTMGAGDLQAMLDVLDPANSDLEPSAATAAASDLSTLVSLGLENQPARAERWLDQLSADHDWSLGPPEMLVVVGASTAAGTATVGRTVWGTLWDNRTVQVDGSPPSGGQFAPNNGVLDEVYGTGNALEVMSGAASTSPTLANAIVTDVVARGEEDFWDLIPEATTNDMRLGDEGFYDNVGAILTASVDPSLPLDTRIHTAADTVALFDEMVVDGERIQLAGLADPVLEGIGTMTQPLLANANVARNYIRLPGADDSVAPADHLSAGDLWDVVGYLGNTEPGSHGLGLAIDGTIHEMVDRALSTAVDGDAPVPLDLEVLGKLGEVMDKVVGEVASERQGAVTDAINGARGTGPALEKAVLGSLGATPAEPLSVLAETVKITDTDDLVQGGSVLGPGPGIRLTYHLTLATLESRPDLATPELMAGLNKAAEEDGMGGVHTFLADSDVFLRDEYEGLGDLRELLVEQKQAVGARLPALLDEIYRVD